MPCSAGLVERAEGKLLASLLGGLALVVEHEQLEGVAVIVNDLFCRKLLCRAWTDWLCPDSNLCRQTRMVGAAFEINM